MRLGLGTGLLFAGLDKFFDILTMWSMYLSPLAERVLPVSDTVFMRAAGVGEMGIGLAILTRWTRGGAYLLALWLLAIAANLAVTGNFWDLAMRDAELSIAAFALARLTEWRSSALAGEAAPVSAPAARGGRAVHL